jgi:hypothetical protein
MFLSTARNLLVKSRSPTLRGRKYFGISFFFADENRSAFRRISRETLNSSEITLNESKQGFVIVSFCPVENQTLC